MTKPVVINIGWARSASTAFRHNFLMRHPRILAVDRDQSLSEGPMAEVVQYIKSVSDSEFERYLPALRSEWAAYAHNHHDRIICVTDEELSIGMLNTGVAPTTIAARCGQLFQGARTLAIVRDQVDAIRSFYALSQRNGHTPGLSLSDWVQRFFLNPKEGENFCYLFSYMTTLRAYLEWQPKRDVFVLLHDRLNTEHAAVYREIARWLGISEEACALLRNDRVNVSPPIPVRAAQVSCGGSESIGEQHALNEYAAGQEVGIRALFERDNMELEREFGVVFSPEDANVQRAL